MSKRPSIIVLGVVATISVAWLAVACGPETAGQAEDSNESPVAPEELQLLSNIRGQIGSPLDASLFQNVGEAATFDSVYAEAAQDSPRVSNLPSRFDIAPESERPVDPAQRYAASLRDAARALDIGAADLEDAGRYEQADALRAWAAKLRADARDGRRPS